MQNRLDALSHPGGDTIQMFKTKEQLEKIGYSVDISCELNPNLSDYDIVHLFNITRVHETYLQFLNAKKQNKPVVLSSIYQNFNELDFRYNPIAKKIFQILGKNRRELIKTFGRAIINRKHLYPAFKQFQVGFKNQQKQLLLHSNLVLPNSKGEVDAIENDFNVKISYEVIPNAVDLAFAKSDNSFVQSTGWKDYVLCVANYHVLKNQIALLKALKNDDYKIVLVGLRVSTHKKYYESLLEFANTMNGRVKILGKLSQEELVSVYSGARVVALPSWFETTGLVCLEGALSGCNIVITNRGHSKEYFEDMAFYCDPADINSIREAVHSAYQSPRNLKLKQHILKKFTWEKTAKLTSEAYSSILL